MGIHSTYTEEIAEEIINWIGSGQTLRAFCRQEGKPAWRTVYDWLEASEEFAARFARARELGFDAIAQEALQIADTPIDGKITTTDEDGCSIRTEDMLGHRKLQVETRLKLLAKWDPKRYGEKLTHLGDPTAPVSLKLSGSDIHG